MKSKRIFGILMIFLLAASATVNAQKCLDQTYCPPEFYGGKSFDYRQQSKAAILEPGDTVSLNVVVAIDEKTRILVCGDSKLGTIQFKLYKKFKVPRKYVRKINIQEEEVPKYAKDESGDIKKDSWGDPIIEGYELVQHRDTIWGKKLVEVEREVYDNLNNDQGRAFWEKSVKKSARMRVEVIVPPTSSAEVIEGCVNVRVGWKPDDGNKKVFKKDR